MPDNETLLADNTLGLCKLEKNDLYFLGTTTGFKSGCASAIIFQSTGEAWRMIGAIVDMCLLHEMALLALTVLESDSIQVSTISVCHKLLDL